MSEAKPLKVFAYLPDDDCFIEVINPGDCHGSCHKVGHSPGHWPTWYIVEASYVGDAEEELVEYLNEQNETSIAIQPDNYEYYGESAREGDDLFGIRMPHDGWIDLSGKVYAEDPHLETPSFSGNGVMYDAEHIKWSSFGGERGADEVKYYFGTDEANIYTELYCISNFWDQWGDDFDYDLFTDFPENTLDYLKFAVDMAFERAQGRIEAGSSWLSPDEVEEVYSLTRQYAFSFVRWLGQVPGYAGVQNYLTRLRLQIQQKVEHYYGDDYHNERQIALSPRNASRDIRPRNRRYWLPEVERRLAAHAERREARDNPDDLL
jgi:hypothetical protein